MNTETVSNIFTPDQRPPRICPNTKSWIISPEIRENPRVNITWGMRSILKCAKKKQAISVRPLILFLKKIEFIDEFFQPTQITSKIKNRNLVITIPCVKPKRLKVVLILEEINQ